MRDLRLFNILIKPYAFLGIKTNNLFAFKKIFCFGVFATAFFDMHQIKACPICK